MHGGSSDGGAGAIGGVQAAGAERFEQPLASAVEPRPPERTRLAHAPGEAADHSAAQRDGSDSERSWLSTARVENPGLPNPTLANGEPSATVETGAPDPELDPNDYAQNLAVPLEHAAGAEQRQVNAMPDHEDHWYEEEEENPHDDFAALGRAMPLLREMTRESEAPAHSVAQFQLIPYQLSGLAMYVPLPPGSPLRHFVSSRKRAPIRDGLPQPEPDETAAKPLGRRPVDAV